MAQGQGSEYASTTNNPAICSMTTPDIIYTNNAIIYELHLGISVLWPHLRPGTQSYANNVTSYSAYYSAKIKLRLKEYNAE